MNVFWLQKTLKVLSKNHSIVRLKKYLFLINEIKINLVYYNQILS